MLKILYDVKCTLYLSLTHQCSQFSILYIQTIITSFTYFQFFFFFKIRTHNLFYCFLALYSLRVLFIIRVNNRKVNFRQLEKVSEIRARLRL